MMTSSSPAAADESSSSPLSPASAAAPLQEEEKEAATRLMGVRKSFHFRKLLQPRTSSEETTVDFPTGAAASNDSSVGSVQPNVEAKEQENVEEVVVVREGSSTMSTPTKTGQGNGTLRRAVSFVETPIIVEIPEPPSPTPESRKQSFEENLSKILHRRSRPRSLKL